MLFRNEEKPEQHSLAYKNYLSTFNHAIAIDTCANGNFLSWEEVLNKPVEDIYTYLQYRYAKSIAEDSEQEYQRKLNKS